MQGAVGLGMRRLSIIDLAGGRQQIFNEIGSNVITFNGEISGTGDWKARPSRETLQPLREVSP